MAPRQAILIIGPTGSGKTPLGEALAEAGLWGRRWPHFDFGARLRAAAEGGNEAGLNDEQLAVVRDSLASEALLTEEQFPIAETILRAWPRQELAAEDWIVLNGLPRHAGQTAGVEPIADIRLVVFLDCPPKVAIERIRTNAGGDRTGRSDDDFESLWKRYEIFASQTAPLVEHYRRRGARVEVLAVAGDTSAEDLRRELEERRNKTK